MLRLQEKGAGSSSWGSKYKQHKGPARMPLGNQPGAKATQKMHQASEDFRPVSRQLCAESKAKSKMSNIRSKKLAEYQKTAWLYLRDTPNTIAATRQKNCYSISRRTKT